MASSIDDVEGGDREDELGVASKVGNVPVEGDALLSSSGLGNGHGDSQDGVGSELALVLGAVESNHLLVDGLLVNGVVSLERRGDDGIDVLNGLEDSLSKVLGLVSIAELNSLVDASGGSGGDSSPELQTRG